MLIAAGVEEVLLFGSVARGTATADSDIDLVAIFADLDYGGRHARRRELEAAARAVVSWPVQVHVTDRPEWRARVEKVSTSFERRIADASVLVASAADEAPVDWGKQMVLPMSNPQEALRYFDARVIPRLRDVAAPRLGTTPSPTRTCRPPARNVHVCSGSRPCAPRRRSPPRRR